jgi:hypothetical protein
LAANSASSPVLAAHHVGVKLASGLVSADSPRVLLPAGQVVLAGRGLVGEEPLHFRCQPALRRLADAQVEGHENQVASGAHFRVGGIACGDNQRPDGFAQIRKASLSRVARGIRLVAKLCDERGNVALERYR